MGNTNTISPILASIVFEYSIEKFYIQSKFSKKTQRQRVRGGRKPEWRRGKMKRKGEGRGKKEGNVWVIEAGRECPATGREYYSLLRLCSINRYSDSDEGTCRRGRVVLKKKRMSPGLRRDQL